MRSWLQIRFMGSVFAAVLALLAACGYRFSADGRLPGEIRHVFVHHLDNRTSETGLEGTFTDDLRYEFIRDKRFAGLQEADAVLSGTVKSLRVDTVSRSGLYTSLERRVTVSVDLMLTDRSGRVVWARTGVSDSESYRVESDSQATDANKRAALLTLSKRLAENIYYRLTENF